VSRTRSRSAVSAFGCLLLAAGLLAVPGGPVPAAAGPPTGPPATFAAEPAGTAVRDLHGTNVVYQYGQPVPSFDGWRTHESTRGYLPLDGTWDFRFDPTDVGLNQGWQRGTGGTGWRNIGVPSAWDLLDTPNFGSWDGASFGTGTAFQDGYGWYRRAVRVPASWSGRSVRLMSLGANYRADVWVNGRYLGTHEGGNTPFAIPVGDTLHAGRSNTVVIRVLRRATYTSYQPGGTAIAENTAIPYKAVDYWPYAGLTRSVWLEAVPTSTIGKVLTSVTADGRLRATAVVQNDSPGELRGKVTLDPGAGTGGRPCDVPVTVAGRSATAVSCTIAVPAARRWSTATPRTYTLTASLSRGHGPRLDQLHTSYGLRTIATTGAQIRINDQPVLLKGVNWHEETAAHGRAMTIPEYDHELGQVLDLKANFIRNTVYNRHPYVYDWADQHGVLVMDDIDTMWLNLPQEQLQTETYGLSRALALMMAWNQVNHPSVFLWGLQNESEIGTGDAATYRAWISQMKAAVNQVDPQRRPVTWASASSNDPAFDLADVVGFNEYFGYFYGKDADLGTTLDTVHGRYPDKPILITENGTWSIAGTHGTATTEGTEEWQAASLANHWGQVVDRRAFTAGYTFWVLKDYKERAGYNQQFNGISAMGLTTFDGTTRKLAYGAFRDLTAG
jgi:beta-glucuronidase